MKDDVLKYTAILTNAPVPTPTVPFPFTAEQVQTFQTDGVVPCYDRNSNTWDVMPRAAAGTAPSAFEVAWDAWLALQSVNPTPTVVPVPQVATQASPLQAAIATSAQPCALPEGYTMGNGHAPIVDTAIWLRSNGMAVHIVKPRGKAPDMGPGWSQQVPMSIDQLKSALEVSERNTGVRTGTWSEPFPGWVLMVLDMDIRDDLITTEERAEVEARLQNILGDVRRFPAVISGSGGSSRHFWMLVSKSLVEGGWSPRKLTSSRQVNGTTKNIWELDFFLDGKQILLPGSIHPNGLLYHWERPPWSETGELAIPILPEADLARIPVSETVGATGAAVGEMPPISKEPVDFSKVSPACQAFLRGERETMPGCDGSGSIFSATTNLSLAPYTMEQAFNILLQSPTVQEIALRPTHVDGDTGRMPRWIWNYGMGMHKPERHWTLPTDPTDVFQPIEGAATATAAVSLPLQGAATGGGGAPAFTVDNLRNLSATKRLHEMRANLQNEHYIFPGLALNGQITLFYAKPNVGKTLLFLHFITDAIKAGLVKGEDVFYINADDNYKGLLTKATMAAEYGFFMISPAEANAPTADIITKLDALAASGEMHGRVVILDTLKKFTDMMNKGAQAALYEVLRKVVTKGGTVIIAGHANKHLDVDGNIVYEGTSDTMNDIDCAYSMYRLSEPDDQTQVVEFRREKDRGDNVAKVSYQYRKAPGMKYLEIVDSVEILSEHNAQVAATNKRGADLVEKYESEAVAITLVLDSGPTNQSAIIREIKTNHSVLWGETSERKLMTALRKLTGLLWRTHRGDKNAAIFTKIRDYKTF